MGECTFWCRIKGAGHKMKYLHAQSMHKVCTRLYTGYTDYKVCKLCKYAHAWNLHWGA